MWHAFPALSKILTNTQWLEKKQTSILSAAIVITIANVFSSISGLVRERWLISFFFDTNYSQKAYEAFLVAFQIPDMMFQLIILGAISATFIPIFSSLKKEDESSAFMMSSIVMNILMVIFIIFGLVIFVFAEQLTHFRTGDAFTPEQLKIATDLTRIMLVAQLFFGISNFFTGILQSYQRFIIPAIAPVLYNLGIILGVVLFSNQIGIYAAGVGVLIGAFIHMAVQLPLVAKLGFRFTLSFNYQHPGVKKLFKLMPPRVTTYAITELQNLALGFLTTSLGNLSFFIIRQAHKLITIPIRLFGVSIGQASLPFLSDHSDERNKKRFQDLLLQSMNQISFFVIPASMLLLILRIPITRLVFGTHNLPWGTTLAIGQAIAFISFSVFCQALVQLVIRAFHALKDTRTPLYIAFTTSVFFMAGTSFIVFFTQYQTAGIAAMISTSAFFELILYLYFFNRKIPGFLNKSFWIPQLKMLSSGFLMAVFLYLPFRILDEIVFDTTRTVELIGLTVVTSTIGLLVYSYFSALLSVKELALLSRVLSNFPRLSQSVSKSPEVFVETSIEDSNY